MKQHTREQKKFKGNKMHLDMLLYALKKDNISFWNRWREEKSSEKIVLTGANLSMASLTGANFKEADLGEASLHGADLTEADFSKAQMTDTNLSESSLRQAAFNGAVLKGTYLYKADLTEAQCINTHFINVNLGKADLTGAKLDSAILRATDISQAQLNNCSLEGATLENVTFTGAYIYGWNIKNCKAKKLQCDFIYTDVKGAERLPKSRNFRAGEFDWYIKNLKPVKKIKKESLPEGRALNHAYISFVKEDRDYVESLANALEIEGIKVWLDRERLQPGTTWQRALKRAIKNGVYIIICFSKNYRKHIDGPLKEELAITGERLQKDKNETGWLIPVKVLRCDIPHTAIGDTFSLTDLQWIDFTPGWNEGTKNVIQLIKGDKNIKI